MMPKTCPIRRAGMRECLGERCAWWVGTAGEGACAVARLRDEAEPVTRKAKGRTQEPRGSDLET